MPAHSSRIQCVPNFVLSVYLSVIDVVPKFLNCATLQKGLYCTSVSTLMCYANREKNENVDIGCTQQVSLAIRITQGNGTR
jgi:hypothetical protein